MDFNHSDLQRMLLDSAERFIGDHYTLEHRRSMRQTADGLDAQAWATFAELGWLSVLFPEETGGLGGSLTDAAVLASALGARCVIEPFASSAVLGAAILAGGAHVPIALCEAIIGGSARIALAHDEPGERYAYTARRSTILEADGDGFRISGQKLLVLDAPSATHLIVTTQGPKGFALVLIPSDAEGIRHTPYALYDGSRAADIAMKNVRVDSVSVLAEGEAAATLFSLALDRTRLILAAQSVGSMEAELDICASYLKERQQFGQPIGQFQALQHIMADMFVAAHQARSMLYFALSKMDAPRRERERAVAMARVNIGEAAQLVSKQAVQLHGGYGVTDEYEVSHHYRRQLVLEKQYGDLEYAAQVAME
jgi:alkylation response protein AidB-like acyl-CoA dehydrogenase